MEQSLTNKESFSIFMIFQDACLWKLELFEAA